MKVSRWLTCLVIGIFMMSLTGQTLYAAAQETEPASDSGSLPETVQSASDSGVLQEPESGANVHLKIDNRNIYAGMKKSDAKGYVARIKDG